MFWVFCRPANTKPIRQPNKFRDVENIGEILINKISVMSRSFAVYCSFRRRPDDVVDAVNFEMLGRDLTVTLHNDPLCGGRFGFATGANQQRPVSGPVGPCVLPSRPIRDQLNSGGCDEPVVAPLLDSPYSAKIGEFYCRNCSATSAPVSA